MRDGQDKELDVERERTEEGAEGSKRKSGCLYALSQDMENTTKAN